jgi:hypothetical protein
MAAFCSSSKKPITSPACRLSQRQATTKDDSPSVSIRKNSSKKLFLVKYVNGLSYF